MQDELLNLFKAFIYNVESRLEPGNLTDINNPIVIKHKGRPQKKRLIASVEKRVLEDSSNVNVMEDHSTPNNIEDSTNVPKGRKCGKCKQYGHYATTCQNII